MEKIMDTKKLDAIFDAVSIMADGAYICVCEIKSLLSRWSLSAVDYFDLPSEYINDAESSWIDKIHPEDREAFSENLQRLMSGEKSCLQVQYRIRAKDGNYVLCSCNGMMIPSEDGAPAFLCGSVKNQDCLNYVDSVTNLRSLYGFLDDVKASLWKKEKMNVVMIGLEDFSRTNDMYNYAFGNRILRKFGALLQQAFLGLGMTYRMDGTKYAVVSKNASIEDLKSTYNEVQNLVAQNFYVASDRVSLSLCAGAVSISDSSVNVDTVYSCLKYAFAESKNAHHGEFYLFKDELNNEQKDTLRKLNVIRNSIIDGCKGFYICYQPIVDANTEKLIGAEALIRWKNETYGVVPPISFVPILEQDSLFPELGRWILKQSMMDCKKILENSPDFIIHVNLSYAQLEKSDFVEDVSALLKETGFPAKNLCLEITERCRLLDINLLKKIFKILQKEGVRIALDDFGTGFSSLGILRELPVNTVKIDRGYVMNIENDPKDRNTVRSINDLAKSFDAEVCVEGVENSGMREELLKFNVNALQGFFYSKPIEIEHFVDKYCG